MTKQKWSRKTRPLVRMEGLEPAHLSALDPKSSVSTNFTTSAIIYFNTSGVDSPLIPQKEECKDKGLFQI